MSEDPGFPIDVETCRAAVLASFPDLATADSQTMTAGWNCLAINMGGKVFRFPRNEEAAVSLRREVGLLSTIGPELTARVPDPKLCSGPPQFAVHDEIPGEHLLADGYARLSEPARQRLAEEMALFHAELHRLDPARMAAAGAVHVGGWQGSAEIAGRALPYLSGNLRAAALESLEAYDSLPPDPLGQVFGFFDGHGWNMAFDHTAGRLNGIYDFGDSGFGPLHQEFVYSSFISSDLTRRIVAAYERITERRLDRVRIGILTRVHRLWELSTGIDDPGHREEMIGNVVRCFRDTAEAPWT